jgi:hypothetical protein
MEGFKMITVNEGLVKKAVVTMEMQEYLELLQEATDGSEFIKVLKKEVKVEVNENGYVSIGNKRPGLSYYKDLIKTLVFMELVNNPETVDALFLKDEKYFDMEGMNFTGYCWYGGDENKVNILSDDAVAEHWMYAMKVSAALDTVLSMDADVLGELCVKIQEYIDDEQIPVSRKEAAQKIYDVLSADSVKIGRDDARWLFEFGFIEVEDVELSDSARK